MNLEMHPSVKLVAEFMQDTVPANELRGVADAIAAIAPCLWSQIPRNPVAPIQLVAPPKSEAHR